MRKLFKILMITVFIGSPILLLTNSCHEEESNKQTLPEITTNNVTGISPSSAVCGGKIISTGGSAVISKGICWCLGPSPTISDQKIADSSGNDQFELTITGLIPNTTYYVRAFAINMLGTAYGDIKMFKTQNGILDIDGNVYTPIKIGTQTWLAENLKVTHFNNGDPVPLITDSIEWLLSTTAAVSDYYNFPPYADTYGKLYNFYAAYDTRNLCPTGWHVPTYLEWRTLINSTGGAYISGGKLKESGTVHWKKTQADVTDSLGFKALPSGYRNSDGSYGEIGIDCIFWTCTEESRSRGVGYYIVDSLTYIYEMVGPKTTGLSVRCIMDK